MWIRCKWSLWRRLRCPQAKRSCVENSLMRLAISPAGLLADFTCKPLQQSYLGEPVPVPILGLVRAGRNVPLVNVTGRETIRSLTRTSGSTK